MIYRIAMDWAWARVCEPSSWAAFGVFFGSVASQIPPDWLLQHILIVAATLCAAIAFALKEVGNKPALPPPADKQFPNDPKPPASQGQSNGNWNKGGDGGNNGH